jgi:hypothetical protein
MWFDIDAPLDEAKLAQLAETSVRPGVKVLSNRPVTLQRRPARELRLDLPPPQGPAVQIVRLGFVGNRVYQLTAQMPPGQEQTHAADVARFFESFSAEEESDAGKR